LQEAATQDVFVIIGTCHAGLKNCFAVTDKDFETPLGIVPDNKEVLVRFRQNGGEPFFDEDSSHRNEHSIEFQLPFLQHTVASKKLITILPILFSFPTVCLIDLVLMPT